MRVMTWRSMAVSPIGVTILRAVAGGCTCGIHPHLRRSARRTSVRATPGWNGDGSCGSGQADQAELAHEAQFVQAAPALRDAPVAEAPDVDPRQGDGTVRSGHAENLALLRTAGRKVLDDQVTL